MNDNDMPSGLFSKQITFGVEPFPLFKAHVMNEKSVENILLYEQIQSLKGINEDNEAYKKITKSIGNLFLEKTAVMEVNVTDKLKASIVQCITQGTCKRIV